MTCITMYFGSTPKCVKVCFRPSIGPASVAWAAGSVTASRRFISMGGKGKGGAGFAAGAPPVGNQESVLGFREEQRENAEAFRERHADDGLDEDLAGRAGIA